MSARVSRTVEHRVNFGDYEGLTIRVSIERDCDETQEQKTLAKLADLLDNALDDDLTQARKLAPEDSYVQEWS